jgi:hypothetical protein
MSDRFVWGQVIERFEYDFDGLTMNVTKYHPRNEGDNILYHCEELRQSTETIFELLISFIAYKRLGLNQHALVAGISKALEL